MGTILENSTCIIAAIDAIVENEDGSETDRGLFVTRDDPLEVHTICADRIINGEEMRNGVRTGIYGHYHVWNVDRESGDPNPTVDELNLHQVIIRPSLRTGEASVSESDWNQRGWILQERVLSRRMIYYTKDKVFYGYNSYSSDGAGSGLSERFMN